MECRAVINSLSDYLDAQENRITENEKLSIEEHLVACPTCQNLQFELTEIKTAARELPLHTPPQAMWVRIANTLEAELPSSERKTREEFPQETWLEWMRRRFGAYTLPQMAGASALAIALIVAGIYGVFGFNTAKPNNLNLTAAQSALLPDENEIKAELNHLMVEINNHKENWKPQARAKFETQLAKIEDLLEKCRNELIANPGDKARQQTLRGLYNEKRQLLKNADSLNH